MVEGGHHIRNRLLPPPTNAREREGGKETRTKWGRPNKRQWFLVAEQNIMHAIMNIYYGISNKQFPLCINFNSNIDK